ncbi:MAG: ATP synthase F1 subunit delta [bacterium]|nr:ATP synthase F1 subunit delta [bacterium]
MTLKPKTIAQAFFDSLRQKSLAEVNETLHTLEGFAQAYTTEPLLRDFLAHPHIPSAEKAQKMREMMKAIKNPEAEALLLFLVRQGKMDTLTVILPLLHDLRDGQFGVLSIHATTATALPNEQQETLKEILKKAFDKKTVELTTQINPDLLGGLVVRVGDQMLDASLRSQLEKIQLALHA